MRTWRTLWAGITARLSGGRFPDLEKGGAALSEPAVSDAREADIPSEPLLVDETDPSVWAQLRTMKELPPLEPDVRRLIGRALADAPEGEDAIDTIQGLMADLDAGLSAQVNLILHAPAFRTVEAAWRGLHHLVCNTEPDEQVRIRVLDISREELGDHLRARAWDRTVLFRALHEDTFGTLGGVPYACLVGDFAFSHDPDDLELLRGIGRIAATIQAPFIAGASARLFGAESWRDVDPRQIASGRLDDPDHAGWRSLRAREEARFLALCLPRILARAPYGAQNDPVDEFAFEEEIDPGVGRDPLWMNAAYALAVNMNRAQKAFGWCTRFRGVGADGAVTNLPASFARADAGGPSVRSPVEAAMSEKSDFHLAKAGLITLLPGKRADQAVFFGAPSLFSPRRFEGPDGALASVVDNLSARLPVMLPVYRFAHYLRVLIRDTSAPSETLDALSRALQAWLDQYVNDDPRQSDQAALARRPLAAGRIDIVGDEAVPGGARVRLALRPAFQLDWCETDIPLSWPLREPGFRAEGP